MGALRRERAEGAVLVIRQAGIIHRTDYWRRGRNLDKLDINELSVGEITRYVMEGKR